MAVKLKAINHCEEVIRKHQGQQERNLRSFKTLRRQAAVRFEIHYRSQQELYDSNFIEESLIVSAHEEESGDEEDEDDNYSFSVNNSIDDSDGSK